MKGMKLFAGLLLGGALVGMSCWAAEEPETGGGDEPIVGRAKVYDFSIRNVTPHKPIWVAVVTFQADAKLKKEKGKCSLKENAPVFYKLDTKKPKVSKKFSGLVHVYMSSKEPEKQEGKLVFNKCWLESRLKEFSEFKAGNPELKKWLDHHQVLTFNPGIKKVGDDTFDSYHKELKNKTFHVDAMVADGILEIHPAASTPRFKIPSNNITKDDLNLKNVMVDKPEEMEEAAEEINYEAEGVKKSE